MILIRISLKEASKQESQNEEISQNLPLGSKGEDPRRIGSVESLEEVDSSLEEHLAGAVSQRSPACDLKSDPFL